MHDWTLVPAGIYYDFHNSWITELRNWLNGGQLPEEFYAVGEQRAGAIGPDVLTLQAKDYEPGDPEAKFPDGSGSILAIADAPPKVKATISLDADLAFYSLRQRRITIRHTSGDDIVAIIEIVSPANKHSRTEINRFLEKMTTIAASGVHFLVIDPFPPGTFDPLGLPMAITEQLGMQTNQARLPTSESRSLFSFDAGELTAYVEPVAVDQEIASMPLFLMPGRYLSLDLEFTYRESYQFFPTRFKQVLEAS